MQSSIGLLLIAGSSLFLGSCSSEEDISSCHLTAMKMLSSKSYRYKLDQFPEKGKIIRHCMKSKGYKVKQKGKGSSLYDSKTYGMCLSMESLNWNSIDGLGRGDGRKMTLVDIENGHRCQQIAFGELQSKADYYYKWLHIPTLIYKITD